MHLFKEQAVRDYAAAAKAIPVIDYGPFFAGENGALERLAEKVAHACENIGFFYALNHGVPDQLIDRAFAASRRFFGLPIEQKLALKLNENNIGYLPINASVQGASTVHKATKPNQNESFFISHDRGPDHPDVVAGKPLRGQNQWPRGYGRAARRYDGLLFQPLARCATACCRRSPLRCGMPADFFAPYFAEEAHATLRFLHYPPQPTTEDNVFGQGPHTDNSFMTALARTDVPGLAVRLPSGEWFPPPVIPGTFLINLGNMMRRWSNDRFLSTPHGVLNDFGHRSLFDRLFPQPEPGQHYRMPAVLHRPRQPAALSTGCLSRSCARFLSGELFPPEGPPLRGRGARGRNSQTGRHSMFDLDRFIEDCRAAVAQDPSHKSARELVARAVSDPAGSPRRARRAATRRGRAALSVRDLDDPQRDLGAADDDHAAQPSDVGGDRRLYRARRQHFLAPPAGCRCRADRGGWRPLDWRSAMSSRSAATSSTPLPTRCRE